MAITLAPQARDKLITDHLDYARSIVRKILRDIGGNLDFDEVFAFATEGLVEAAGRFDPGRGVAFTTFSYYRVRGAVFDGLRKQGWLPRSAYARYLAAQNELLENRCQRQTDHPADDSPGEAAAELATTLDQLATVFVTSLDADKQAEVADEDALPADEVAAAKEERSVVRQAVAALPERERQLVELYYFKGLTLEQAGEELGASKSWCSRLHSRAIALLTSSLGSAFAP